MNTAQVIPFNFDSKQVRAYVDEFGEPWFCAADVCKALGYANNRQAIQKNCREKGVSVRDTLTAGGRQALVFINDGNLYRLILKSRKEEALRFESWVCDEVLPAIRRTGQYHDTNNKMATLVSESLGVTELTALKGVIADRAKSVPKEKRISFMHTMHHRLHTRFNVPRTELIRHEDFADACRFVAAYALDGEWIPRPEAGTVTLDRYDASDIYLLMTAVYCMMEHGEVLKTAATALGSKPLSNLSEQLSRASWKFKDLNRTVGAKVHTAYKSFGNDGGYRMGAIG